MLILSYFIKHVHAQIFRVLMFTKLSQFVPSNLCTEDKNWATVIKIRIRIVQHVSFRQNHMKHFCSYLSFSRPYHYRMLAILHNTYVKVFCRRQIDQKLFDPSWNYVRRLNISIYSLYCVCCHYNDFASKTSCIK